MVNTEVTCFLPLFAIPNEKNRFLKMQLNVATVNVTI